MQKVHARSRSRSCHYLINHWMMTPSSPARQKIAVPNQKKIVSEGSDDDSNRMKSSTSPFKGQIDLNIQPEREEELSPGADSVNVMALIQDATERYLRHQRLSTGSNSNSAVNQALQGGGTGEKMGNTITLDTSHQDADNDHHGTLPMKPSASISANG
ncbi:hypothetical protein Patl1_10867 [Pistacia atlantica]|uniref:Uncharacterized protein n=1 Tax=Pistacia atlantica TaxID=434234 RepID=A0ACC1A6J1_9ROSI|nr:hypothetical protein Patl1_10867 [Pistacia atlantica]